ncbi:MAG: type VI secretion system baseplate subunit TssF, partial [Acidobacteriaceae bacterium]|nr:type VI secretion system baseplate subunit TssF [Acidobacteriaceae bacterium]
MKDELLPYYQQELTFIRQMAAEFKDKYPGVAGGLLLDTNTCEDPHVERLIEAFALLAGRVRHKLDDEFPEITESLLDVLYPHYLKPIPPQAIVQFHLDLAQSSVTAAVDVPSGTRIHSKPDEGNVCSFRTCYPVKLWPIRVTGASISTTSRFASPGPAADVAAVIRIQMECLGSLKLSQLSLDSIRFYLDGESAAVYTLYEFLFLNTLRVSLRALPASNGAQVILPASSLRQVGFDVHEGVLPYSDRSFLGYRLLQEYFSFPEKFLFFDLVGLNRIALDDFGNAFEIAISLTEADYKHRLTALEQAVTASTFQLGCTPMINLFERIAEPIRVSHTKTEYRIVPDQHRQLNTEVYSVDRVASMNSYEEEPKVYLPFYALRHGRDEDQQRFWYSHRRASFRKNDNGTEVYLSLVDLDFKPAVPAVDMLTVHVTCTNRDQASRIKLSGEFGELETEGAGLVRVRCVRKPTQTARHPMRKSVQWRLISHLSLNYLSIVEGGREALQEILRVYDFNDDPAIRKQIAGIARVHSKPCVSRVISETGVAFCRGTDVVIE